MKEILLVVLSVKEWLNSVMENEHPCRMLMYKC